MSEPKLIFQWWEYIWVQRQQNHRQYTQCTTEICICIPHGGVLGDNYIIGRRKSFCTLNTAPTTVWWPLAWLIFLSERGIQIRLIGVPQRYFNGPWIWNFCSLQWSHNERDYVSNHRRLDCLLNRLCRRRLNKTSKLRVTGLCEGNLPVPGEGPVTRKCFHLMTSSCECCGAGFVNSTCITKSSHGLMIHICGMMHDIFPNLNGCTVTVWEWIRNFIPHFLMGEINYPCHN